LCGQGSALQDENDHVSKPAGSSSGKAQKRPAVAAARQGVSQGSVWQPPGINFKYLQFSPKSCLSPWFFSRLADSAFCAAVRSRPARRARERERAPPPCRGGGSVLLIGAAHPCACPPSHATGSAARVSNPADPSPPRWLLRLLLRRVGCATRGWSWSIGTGSCLGRAPRQPPPCCSPTPARISWTGRR
jgi:hypothetical protein